MIIRALQMLGEKPMGGTLTSAEQSAYLDVLNGMLESWSIHRNFVYQILQENFALTTSTATYTIGNGGNFNTTRPTKIVGGFIRDAVTSDTALKIIPWDAYDSIVNKGVAGTWPKYLFYDGGMSATSTGTIKLYPAPAANLTLFIDSWAQLTQFASITTNVILPPGYRRAIEANMALELAPGGVSASPELVRIAREAKANVMSVNLPETVARMDMGIVHRKVGNIIGGP